MKRFEIKNYDYNLNQHQMVKLDSAALESASELYRPSDRRLSAKLVPNVANRGRRVVRATDPHGR
jgi:hypothetical protein